MVSAQVNDYTDQQEKTGSLQMEKAVTQEYHRVPNLRDRQTLSRSKALKDFSTPSPLWATSKRKPVTNDSPKINFQKKANHILTSNETDNVQVSVVHDLNNKKVHQSLKCEEKKAEIILQGQCLPNNDHESLHLTSSDIKIVCYMCNGKLVCGDDVVNHLLFSPLRCKFCDNEISSCRSLREQYTFPCQCPLRHPRTLPHDYSYWFKPMERLQYYIFMDLSITKYLSNLKLPLTQQQIKGGLEAYLLTLLPIRELMPWKTAFQYFADHIPLNTSQWPPPLPRLGWVICGERSTIQDKSNGILKCTSNLSGNRKGTLDPHVEKVPLTPSQSTSSIDNTGIHGTNSSQLLSSNTPSTGQQESYQGVVRTKTTKNKTQEQPSLLFKILNQSLPTEPPSKPTQKIRETSAYEISVPSYQSDNSSFAHNAAKDLGSPPSNGEAADLSSFCKNVSSSPSKCSSPVSKHSFVHIQDIPAKGAVVTFNKCVSPDLYKNQSKFSSWTVSPCEDTDRCLAPLKNFADIEKNSAESVITRELTSSVNLEPDEPNTSVSGVGVEEKNSKNSSHQLTVESSNSDSTDVTNINQPDRSEFSSNLEAKHLTCSKSVNSQVVKQPGFPRPVVIQNSNDPDSSEPFSSQMTGSPNRLQSDSTVLVKETHSSDPVTGSASVASQDEENTNHTVHMKPVLTPKNPDWSVSDSRKSISPKKCSRKRRARCRLWTKLKSRRKNDEVLSEEDEDGTVNLKMMSFVAKEDRDSERFLLISWPIQPCPEECPECYCILTSELITFNNNNFRIGKVTCPECQLSMYIKKTSPA